jgi:hypothetical protein
MTATTSGGAPTGAIAFPSAPSVAFAVGAGAGVACVPAVPCSTCMRRVAASVFGTRPSIGSETLRSQRRTFLVVFGP